MAVDAYGWLHRGTVACAVDLALGKPTNKYVGFAMGRVKMLQHFGVTPYLVFDGDYLPSKAREESGRAAQREASKKAGLELLRQGKSSQAYVKLQKAIDVTPQMARHLIDALIEVNVNYVVAPYEADAQMYYLERSGIVDAILSEDSDLLVFGCKNLITKLDQFGECVHICRDDFSSCKEMALAGWTAAEFRSMAILSGCDYLENIPRLGLKTAHRLVRKHKVIDKIIRVIRFDGQYTVPADYLEQFRRAELTFLHQRVYCPLVNRMVMCSDPASPLKDVDLIFIGPEIEEKLIQKIARGELDPMTKKPLLIQGNSGNTYRSNSSSRPKQPPQPAAASVKPPATLLSFFKPATHPQPKRGICTPGSVPASFSSKPPKLIKRRSSLSGDVEDKLCKKPRVLAEAVIATSQPSSTEEVSKYFPTVNPKRSKTRIRERGPTSQPQTVLQKALEKENIEPEWNAPPLLDPKLQDKGVISPVEERGKFGDEAAGKLVAQGWRDHYSFKPQAAAAHLASLMDKEISGPASVMRTPLQRIGANAMRGASRPPPGKTRTVVREVKKWSQTPSIPRSAKGSPAVARK